MSTRCRTCGNVIYCVNAKNIFQQSDNSLLHQIETLTGLFLLDQTEFPSQICGTCEVSLSEAVGLRERIIRTQQLLLDSDSVSDAYIKIDSDKVEKLYVEVGVEQGDDMPVYDYGEDESEKDPLEHLNKVNEEFKMEEQSAMPAQHTDPTLEVATPQLNVQPKPKRPASSISISFGPKVKQVPRNYCTKLSKDELAAHKRERRKRDCICEQCGRHFTCASNFKVHLLTHTGVKNFTCKQCPLKFYTPHLLRVHELGHERPYPCRYCEKTYTDISGRIQHERNHHTNYKPFKCTACDKTFAVSNGLKKHMVTHSGIRNFHCTDCNVSFKKRTHLTNHYRCKGHEQNAQISAAVSSSVPSEKVPS